MAIAMAEREGGRQEGKEGSIAPHRFLPARAKRARGRGGQERKARLNWSIESERAADKQTSVRPSVGGGGSGGANGMAPPRGEYKWTRSPSLASQASAADGRQFWGLCPSPGRRGARRRNSDPPSKPYPRKECGAAIVGGEFLTMAK